MWNVPPPLMCRKHLLGEHVETHMFASCLTKGKHLDGYIDKGLVDISLLRNRHDSLAKEMVNRGYSHASPMLLDWKGPGTVDSEANVKELARRCLECRKRIEAPDRRGEVGGTVAV